MLQKFNVKIEEKELNTYLKKIEINNKEELLYNYNKDAIIKTIKEIAEIDDEKKEVKIKHTDIIKDWFPDSGCHIFLSHSHKDKGLAIKIANYLFENYQIKTFIDSDFWQFVDDAVSEINSSYSKCPKPQDHLLRYDSCLMVGTNFYLTLSNALMDAIDKSDCCLFLNTGNSISEMNSEKESTYSPWIYTELNIIDKIRLNPHIDREVKFGDGMEALANDEVFVAKSNVATENYKVKVEYEVDPTFKLSTIESDTLGLILSSPEKVIKELTERERLYEKYSSDDDFRKIIEKVRPIKNLDDLYDFIFSRLPKASGTTNI